MKTIIEQDVVILGGGLVGATLAIALAQGGLKTLVIDKADPALITEPSFDGRTTAVALGSKYILDNLQIWDLLNPVAQPIWDIKVYEGNMPWLVHYDHAALGQEPMGYILLNDQIRKALFKRAHDLSHLTWKAPAEVKTLERGNTKALITLTDDSLIQASLVVGAEGRFSPSRKAANIPTQGWTYKQAAVVCHVTHERPHHGVAYEIFLPTGPLAILPLKGEASAASQRSGVIWSTLPAEAESLMHLSDEALARRIYEQFPHLGTFKIASQRWSYPLSALLPSRFIDQRLVIIGDAAHIIHPIAGQGVNLGWRDAKCLADLLISAKRNGLDLGSHTLLKRYERARQKDTLSTFYMMDSIYRLFTNDYKSLKFIRNAGLAFVNRVPPLKRFFMRHAMGLAQK